MAMHLVDQFSRQGPPRGWRPPETFFPIHKAASTNEGEDWHTEYDAVREDLENIETDLFAIMQKWLKQVVNAMNDPNNHVQKAEVPTETVLGFLDNMEWWRSHTEELANLLIEKLIRLVQAGAKTAHWQLANRIDIGLNWELDLPSVRAWAVEHAAELVKNISDSVRNDMRQVILHGLTQGRGWRGMRDQIEESVGLSGWRAERIARTETIRAHNHGAEERYKASGTVEGVMWLGDQPGACKRCRELNGKIIPLGQVFYHDPTFGDGLPPRHPSCRCAIKPVLKEQMPNVATI